MSPMTETRRRRARRLFAVAALACAALPCAPALAAPDQLSLIEDEKLMLERRPGRAGRDARRGQGARRRRDPRERDLVALRALTRPRRRSPRASTARTRPRTARRSGCWTRFVAGAQARGMQVVLTPTGPIPAWASQLQGLGQGAQHLQARPDAVRRLRARAGHALSDREDVVDLERAEPALVADAAVRGRGRRQAVQRSAQLYRALARSAIAGLRATGHTSSTDQIWLGETAPLGDDPSRLQRPAQPARAASAARSAITQDLAGDVPARRVLPRHIRRLAGRRRGQATRSAGATRSSRSTATRTIRTRVAARARRCRRPTRVRSRSASPRG